MQITINSITRCNGSNGTNGSHYHVVVTAGGIDRIIEINKDELAFDPDDIRSAGLQRLRSYLKENNISTFSAAKNALEGLTFQI